MPSKPVNLPGQVNGLTLAYLYRDRKADLPFDRLRNRKVKTS